LKSLHLPNVKVQRELELELVKTGINAGGKFYEADVVILATGFETAGKLFRNMDVRGRGGVSVEEHWEKSGTGGIGAYNTTAIHGFPNLFVLLGPNSATGHTSALIAVE
jgi:cation diffusion facilitator CzcD-associated flavoprotein CzcO